MYLYADIGLTTKVTAGELKTSVKSRAVAFSAHDIYFFGLKVAIIAGIYGSVDLWLNYSNESKPHQTKTFYTAEYTPE